MGGILEVQRVARQQPELGSRDVGHHRHHDVGLTAERRGEPGEQVTRVGLDAVGPGAGHGQVVPVRGDDAGRRAPGAQRRRDGPRTRAQVDRGAAVREPGCGTRDQWQALPAGDVDPWVDAHGEVAEFRASRDPGDGLAGVPPVGQ